MPVEASLLHEQKVFLGEDEARGPRPFLPSDVSLIAVSVMANLSFAAGAPVYKADHSTSIEWPRGTQDTWLLPSALPLDELERKQGEKLRNKTKCVVGGPEHVCFLSP